MLQNISKASLVECLTDAYNMGLGNKIAVGRVVTNHTGHCIGLALRCVTPSSLAQSTELQSQSLIINRLLIPELQTASTSHLKVRECLNLLATKNPSTLTSSQGLVCNLHFEGNEKPSLEEIPLFYSEHLRNKYQLRPYSPNE